MILIILFSDILHEIKILKNKEIVIPTSDVVNKKQTVRLAVFERK